MENKYLKWVLLLVGGIFVYQYFICKMLKIIPVTSGFSWKADLSPMKHLVYLSILIN